MLNQLSIFLIHLRLHYQFFILSGGYLLAALLVNEINWMQYGLQFFNVHILLFGGATAYNSWWDKDEGPIGGLKTPPKMKAWMRPAALTLQCIGLAWAVSVGWNYAVIYALSMLFFWLYSSPITRWKGRPLLSLAAIGISTGMNSFFLGYLAAGGYPITWFQDIVAFGVACVVLSLYPVSQVFQTEEDHKRGDLTFARRYGLQGVKWLFTVLFPVGVAILSLALIIENGLPGYILGVIGGVSYLGILFKVWRLKGNESEYTLVMKIKYLASLSFVFFMLVWIANGLLP